MVTKMLCAKVEKLQNDLVFHLDNGNFNKAHHVALGICVVTEALKDDMKATPDLNRNDDGEKQACPIW